MTVERAPKIRNLTPPDAYARIFAEALTALPGAETPTEDVRKKQFEKFEKIGFPGPKVEEWKYSPLGAIAKTAFRPVDEGTFGHPDVDPYLLPDADATKLVFINGDLDTTRSDRFVATDQLTVASLRDALQEGLVDADDLLADGTERLVASMP